jgi:Family of unknown function (DUF6049)
MRSVRSVVRPLIAVLLALSCLVLVAATAHASNREVQIQSARTDRGDSRSLAISITGVSPQFATSKTATVTVRGTLSNHTGSTIRGIQVQLQWYPLTFLTRSGMESYANGGSVSLQYGPQTLQPVGNPDELSHSLANGASAHWSVSFNLSQSFIAYGYPPAIGDYPLQVQASSSSSSHQATSRTFLPYWPGKGSATPLKVAWIWPLIDTPQQGACPQTLATNSLAGSFAANGRLSTLLGAGLQWASRDDLTWAIDPALLSDATVMTRRYFIGGGNAECNDRTPEKPSPAAASWLSKLAGTAGQSAFLTPYANVDAAALSHAGLEADLTSAYQLGNAVARKVLPNTFGPNADGTVGGAALAAAWPAGGTADAGLLTSLARDGGINTVVLNSGELKSSASPYDNAVTRTKTSAGSSMSVLLADSAITGILGSASAGSSAGAQFAVEQDFLAQTAMIVAEGPNASRSLVVAPPTGWDPSPAEAAALLSLTKAAPWLRTTDLGALASEAARLPAQRLPDRRVSGAELPEGYVDHLQSLSANVTLFEELLSTPPKPYLTMLAAAVAVTQSSAWRGGGSPGGWRALTELSSYISDLQHRVMLIPVKKILLAGTTGSTLASVQNGLNLPYLPPLSIAVRVGASPAPGSSLQVTSPADALVVPPGLTGSVKLGIHSTTIGTATLQLQLLTKGGSPLTWKHASEPLSVEVTRFGRTILVVIVGALGVLVLATVFRLRRKRRRGGESEAGSDDDAGNRTDSRAHAGGTG